MSASKKMNAVDRLIVALDYPSAALASRAAEQLRGHAGMFKVGSELFTAEGAALARYLVASGEKVFLDLKFHDIPNTVRAASREAAGLGVTMFNVHASGGRKMMEAALEGAREASERLSRPRARVLAVTLLTSLSQEDLAEVGIAGGAEEAVARLSVLAKNAGLDGVVASPREITRIRQVCGDDFLIVTPGIRPGSSAADDQTRTATPGAAIQAGADYIAVGRPITASRDPVAAADAIVAEMELAMAKSHSAGIGD